MLLKCNEIFHNVPIFCRQRVYGSTTAVVKVGYYYEDCVEPIWDVQTTKITGQDLTVSDVGGWDLDIHHRYNPQEGILYKGDGSNVYLSERPRLIFNLMGKFFSHFIYKYDQ